MYFLIPMKSSITILVQFICAWISFDLVFRDWGDNSASVYQVCLSSEARYNIHKVHIALSFFVLSNVIMVSGGCGGTAARSQKLAIGVRVYLVFSIFKYPTPGLKIAEQCSGKGEHYLASAATVGSLLNGIAP